MLVLRSSPPSPFGRKVKIAAALLGLSDRITVERADTGDPNDTLRSQNPLGKIPTLILENGETLYDSRVIIEYLDALAGGGRLIPAEDWSRFEALRQQALADGIMDAAILQSYEARWRPEERREPRWLEHQQGKIDRALALAEATLSTPPQAFHVGHVALACALGYLDLRFEGRWRQKHPRLVAWLADFEGRVPAFGATRIAA
jgi:glutathione S-transferase